MLGIGEILVFNGGKFRYYGAYLLTDLKVYKGGESVDDIQLFLTLDSAKFNYLVDIALELAAVGRIPLKIENDIVHGSNSLRKFIYT